MSKKHPKAPPAGSGTVGSGHARSGPAGPGPAGPGPTGQGPTGPPAPGPGSDEAPPPDAIDPGSPTEAGEIPSQEPEEVARWKAEAEALRAKADASEDRRKREQADFVNEIRRLQRQADDRVRFAVQAVVTDLLPVTDAVHGAIEGLADSEHEKRVAEGLRMVEKELLDILGRHGVQRIDALNKPFDPTVHEAIMEMESPAAARTVLQVIRPGFTLHGRVVRPAHVIVSRPPKEAPAVPPADGPASPTSDEP